MFRLDFFLLIQLLDIYKRQNDIEKFENKGRKKQHHANINQKKAWHCIFNQTKKTLNHQALLSNLESKRHYFINMTITYG